MKISIITPAFNSGKTIERTIKSVINQVGVDLEYIIIDGASTDNTLEIVNKYQDRISKIVSENDKGIYDAMNKGVQLAGGEVIGILNSDDFYYNDNVLKKVGDCFEQKKCDACYGDLVYFNEGEENKVVRFWSAGEFKEYKLDYGWAPPHPTFFVKKGVYQIVGNYRLDLPIAADYEFMLRVLKKYRIKPVYLPFIFTRMQSGGTSAKNFKNRIKGFKQLVLAWSLNGFSTPLIFYFRPLFKIHQYLFRYLKKF